MLLVKKHLQKLLLCASVLMSAQAQAASPVPFDAQYEVHFLAGFSADATLALVPVGQDEFELNALAKLRLGSKTLTTVKVEGNFAWEGESVIPKNYDYIQTGLGKSARSIAYDWQNGVANTVVKGKEKTLPLAENILDELSMYIDIQKQAAAGIEDIKVSVIDEDKIKEYHYQLIGEEQLETDLGLFNTLKFLRIRKPDSKRITEIWLAKDWHYTVLQLQQKSRLGTFTIDLLQATVDGVPLESLN